MRRCTLPTLETQAAHDASLMRPTYALYGLVCHDASQHRGGLEPALRAVSDQGKVTGRRETGAAAGGGVRRLRPTGAASR